MLRALLTQLGRDREASGVRVPSHRVGPPETLSAVEYANLLRAPDRRTLVGKRDHALLRLLGDCGLRNAELRALTVRAIRRPGVNSAHHRLLVAGKGDVEREVAIPTATYAALQAWLRAHPWREAGGLRDVDVVFARLARDGAVAGCRSRGWPSLCAATVSWRGSPSVSRIRMRYAATTRRRSPGRVSRSRRSWSGWGRPVRNNGTESGGKRLSGPVGTLTRRACRVPHG